MIDAIYCISLNRLPERRNNCIQLLSTVDFCPVYFLDAVDASMYTKQDFHDEGIYEYEDWEISYQESQIEKTIDASVLEVLERMKYVSKEDRAALFLEHMEHLCFSDEEILIVPTKQID